MGRTGYVAFGFTNSYGDTQDLYVETVDPNNPDRYMEGDKSLPFSVVDESISIKDKNAPQGYREEKLKIRLTARGPVISGVLRNLKTERVLTLRFAPFESMDPCIGLRLLLTAKSIEEARRAAEHLNIIGFNMVLGDSRGEHRMACFRKASYSFQRRWDDSFRRDGQRRQLGRLHPF